MGFLDFLFGKPKRYKHSTAMVSGSSSQALAHKPNRALNPEASVLDIRVGDVISYNATDFVVKHRYVYENNGWEWFSYHLVDTISGQKLWLDAEDDDELEVAVNTPVKLDLSMPIPKRLFVDGVTYHLDEHGYAKVLVESENTAPRYTEVEFWDFYDDADERSLGIERWDNELEASIAQYIEPYELNILSIGGQHA